MGVPVKLTASSAQRKRGWLIVTASVVAVITAIGVGVFITARTPVETSAPAVADGPTSPQHMEAWVGELGILLSTKTSFAETVTLSDPTLRAGKTEAEGELWPLDGREHEGEDLEPLTLPAGRSVSIAGLIRPACDGSDVEMIISVISQNSDGEKLISRFSARNPEDLASATRRYCRQGPTVSAGMNRLYPDGDAVIGVTVVNPGPDEITVDVPAYSDEHVTWTPLTGTVPAGEKVRFEIQGTQVGCEPGERASWQEGRLLIDGEPFVVTSDDAWC